MFRDARMGVMGGAEVGLHMAQLPNGAGNPLGELRAGTWVAEQFDPNAFAAKLAEHQAARKHANRGTYIDLIDGQVSPDGQMPPDTNLSLPDGDVSRVLTLVRDRLAKREVPVGPKGLTHWYGGSAALKNNVKIAA
jgi:hypothetical protein